MNFSSNIIFVKFGKSETLALIGYRTAAYRIPTNKTESQTEQSVEHKYNPEIKKQKMIFAK